MANLNSFITDISISLLFVIFIASSANAATLTVTNLNDSGAGSLRQAIADANANDDIVFDTTIAGGTIVLTSGEILIDHNLDITGPNPELITISGNNNSRIFNTQTAGGGVTVNVSNINFINSRLGCGGLCTVTGGAVRVGTATVINFTDCSFVNNRTECTGVGCVSQGGAVGIDFSQVINGANFNRCTFYNNSASCGGVDCIGEGGAFSNIPGSSVASFRNSTLYENEASCLGVGCRSGGGALIDFGADTVINNTTFANNSATCSGVNCTVEGSTISNPDTILTVSNTIIQNVPGVSSPNCFAAIFNDQGNNIQFPGNSCGAGIQVADADLGPLQDNGGLTETMAITMQSPAFEGGNNATCESIDQRGVVRPQFEICDIGAYELEEVVRNVPTLSQWGLIGIAVLLGIIGFMVIRRRQVHI